MLILLLFYFAVVIHECAHGWVASKFGDPTAKHSGRLTLNPLVHIDPFGTILLPLILLISGSGIVIGWAKPVPVNFMNLRNPKRDMIWVGLAGPVSNILMALLLAIFYKMTSFVLLLYGVQINLLLAVFNLVPVPPLDGSRIVTGLLPFKYARIYLRLERFGFIIIIALLYAGLLHKVVLPIVMRLMFLLGMH